LGGILGSVGHRVKIHKITSVTGKERGDLEIKRLRAFTKTSRTYRSADKQKDFG
jgi:hypothetical protein